MSNTQGLFSTTLANPSGYPGQSFFGGNNIQIFLNSGTFIVPPDVYRIRVRVWGAGGSGGVSCAVANARVCSGGGGGGHRIKVINTTPGTSYAVTVGTGGAVVTGAATTNGNAGGTSSFGTAVTCTGGGAGQAAAGSSPQTVTGGAGGTSTGGDVNYTGGAGGSATCSLNGAGVTRSAASGGGSSGSIFGSGYAGGNVTINWNTASDIIAASGGGGVGGKGGNVSITGVSANLYSCGGGTFNAAADSSNSVVGAPGNGFVLAGYSSTANGSTSLGRFASNGLFKNNAVVPFEIYNMMQTNTPQGVNVTGYPYGSSAYFMGAYPANAIRRFPGDILISSAIDASQYIQFPIDGCGYYGCENVFANTTTVYKYTGAFGGGGGVADVGNNNVIGCFGGVGGGGGGTAGRSNPDAGTFSGRGGDGMIIVEW